MLIEDKWQENEKKIIYEKVKMLLVTTATSIFTKTDSESTILLGEWCLKNKKSTEQLIKNLESEILNYIWEDESEIDKGIEYCQKIYTHVLKNLIPILNEVHSINKELKYWDLLLSHWLFSYIQIMYDRYRHIKLAKDKCNSLYTYVISEKMYQYINVPDTFLKNAATNDEYNLQLYSQIVKFLDIPYEVKTCKIEKLSTSICIQSSIKEKVVRAISKVLNKVFCSKKVLIVHPFFKCNKLLNLILLSLKSKFLFVFDNLQYDICIAKDVDLLLRKSLFKVNHAMDEFECLIFESFQYNFPIIYLEAFKIFSLHVNNVQVKKPNVIFSKNAFHHNEIFKFYCAQYHHDITIAYGQHGGNIGIDKQNIPEIMERNFSDIYFSNGWQEEGVRVLSMPKCNNFIIKSNDKINLIMTAMPRYFYRFVYQSDSSKMIRYLHNTNTFCKKIDYLQDKLVIRTYPQDYGWRIEERLLEENQNLVFDNITEYNKQILSSRLNVFDHMHTGYLESFNFNKPTVIFIVVDSYPFRENAQRFIQKLKEAKILFDNPISAADFVKTIYDDVDAWWLSSEVQKAKNAFCERYAKSSDTWVDEWVDELNRVVNT